MEDNVKSSSNVGQKPIANANGGGGYVDPWLDPSMSVRVVPKQPPTPIDVNVEEPKVDATPETKPTSEPEPKIKDPEPKSETPFIVKPVIVPPVPDTQLTQLGSTYMEQRDQMLKTRESVAEVKEAELDIKIEDIPKDVVDKQKQLFEEQQAALRVLRSEAIVRSETKSKADVEQAMPLPAPDPIQIEEKKRDIMVEAKRAFPYLVDPVGARQLESLRVEQLKKMCSERGLPMKGNKAELIARLKM